MAAAEWSSSFPFLAMVTVTGAEYIVISAQSRQQPHSEVFHLSVLSAASGCCIKPEIINAEKRQAGDKR